MSWFTEIRQKARQKRQELGLSLASGVPADQVLALLERSTSIRRSPLPPGDARLDGAEAVLSVPAQTIYQNGSRPEEWQRSDAAHEFAHFFLHSGSCRCTEAALDGDAPGTALGAAREEEEQPPQRREKEASLYAAELLLPDRLLRRLFFEEGLTADRIASQIGLAPRWVLAHMTEALLRPPLPEKLPEKENRSLSVSAQSVALDPSQKAAAEIPAGPLLLGAGPGTGKTKTLIGRCLYLVQQKHVPAKKILCLTFSHAAAQEMRERIAQAGIGSGGGGPWVGTFHSFGLHLLKRFGAQIGLPAEIKLIGTLDALTLLENHLPELQLDALDNLYDPALHLKAILGQISRAKDELCAPEQYIRHCQAMQDEAVQAAAEFSAIPGKKRKSDQEAIEKQALQAAKAREVAHCYAVYERLMTENGFLDYGDLISRSVALLENCAEARDALQTEFPHVLADEYQDVNRACARMIRLLSGKEAAGLWVVGDHRQSIYRFRGASPANIDSFHSDYPDGKRMDLRVNYRSSQPVVDCFGAVARKLTPEEQQAGFSIWQAQRGTDPALPAPVLLALAPDAEGQADGIARQIEDLKPVYPYSQQAILCRTHSQAQNLADLLTQRNIPVLYLGGLMERPEVKDLLCLLAIFSSRQPAELLRVGGFPEYRIPQEDTLTFLKRLRTAEASLEEGLQDLSLREGLSPEAKQGLQKIGTLFALLKPYENNPAELLGRFLFSASGFLRDLAQQEPKPFLKTQKLQAVHQLYSLALAFEKRVIVPAAPVRYNNRSAEFLSHLRRQTSAGESPRGAALEESDEEDAVRILTAHKAKGLEFPVVYVPNLSQGQFPARGRSDGLQEPPGMAAASGDAEDEERCLFFVALSRARDRLILSRAAATGQDRDLKPSSLLPLIDGWLQARPLAQVSWPAGRPAVTEEENAVTLPGPIPTFSSSALETYARCPRQYYYQRERKMPEDFSLSAYPQFQNCLRQILGWMEEEQIAGRAVGDSGLLAKLEEVWTADGPVGLPHEEKYKETAGKMLMTASAMMREHDPEPRPSLTAELSNCRVTVSPDALWRRQNDGARILVHRLTKKSGDSDHTDKKLSLLRRASTEQWPETPFVLALHYLTDGQTQEIPSPSTSYQNKLEEERVKKYEKAADGIRLRLFPPQPSAADACQTCAYTLICPL